METELTLGDVKRGRLSDTLTDVITLCCSGTPENRRLSLTLNLSSAQDRQEDAELPESGSEDVSNKQEIAKSAFEIYKHLQDSPIVVKSKLNSPKPDVAVEEESESAKKRKRMASETVPEVQKSGKKKKRVVMEFQPENIVSFEEAAHDSKKKKKPTFMGYLPENILQQLDSGATTESPAKKKKSKVIDLTERSDFYKEIRDDENKSKKKIATTCLPDEIVEQPPPGGSKSSGKKPKSKNVEAAASSEAVKSDKKKKKNKRQLYDPSVEVDLVNYDDPVPTVPEKTENHAANVQDYIPDVAEVKTKKKRKREHSVSEPVQKKRKSLCASTEFASTTSWEVSEETSVPFGGKHRASRRRFHPKDFRNRTLYNARRVQRMQTLDLLNMKSKTDQ